MHKLLPKLLIVLLTLVTVSCGSHEKLFEKDPVKKKWMGDDRRLIDRSQIDILSPSIELYDSRAIAMRYDSTACADLKTQISDKLREALPDAEFYNCKFSEMNDQTINDHLQRPLYIKYANPKWQVKADDLVLVNEDSSRYTLLFSLSAGDGMNTGGTMYIAIIDNRKKLLRNVHRYDFNHDPMAENFIEDRIAAVLDMHTKTPAQLPRADRD